MLNRCIQLLGLGRIINKESRRKKESRRTLLLDQSLQSSRDISVRIVHAGGREELYENAVPASQLMEKYPGMCVARPEVFKNPHESLLWPEDELLTGHKYLMIPSTTAQKLKRKHQERVKDKDIAKDKEEMSNAMITGVVAVGHEISEEPFFSAKDFYSSKGRSSSRPSRKKSGRKKKPFVGPISRGRMSRGLVWEPSLTSIQELSP